MNNEKAEVFARLHVKGRPLVLYNIWDAGSARAVAAAGAPALATGSWSVAAAQGYADGEAIPLDLVETLVRRITATVDLPLSVDFESGYALVPADVAANVGRIIAAGAVGMNFEDGMSDGTGLHETTRQTACIAAIRDLADGLGAGLFINARTDLFLLEGDATRHGALVEAAIARGRAYAQAGADGFFVPGLTDEALIGRISAGVPLPLNVMNTKALPPLKRLAALGVARISHGPGPYRAAMAGLTEAAASLYR